MFEDSCGRVGVLSPTQKPKAAHVVEAVGLRVNRSSRRWSAYLYAVGWSGLASPPDSFCKLRPVSAVLFL